MGSHQFDAARSFRMMMRMRLVDMALVDAWARGLVPGEYHSGIGEEGINAGVLAHLSREDTLALDHRNTAPLVGRGTDLVALMLEVLGSEAGIAGGMAGHMHIFDREANVSADAIVGASGPLAVGHAVAHDRLRTGGVAIAFHGEAAMNQGMLMEAYNLASVWGLPVVFVCKDNRWGITTYSKDVSGGDPVQRARSFGLETATASGHDVRDVHDAAGRLVERARAGRGPGFLHATCHRPGGHFEGDPLVDLLRRPGRELSVLAPELQAGLAADGGAVRDKLRAMADIGKRAGRFTRDSGFKARRDPVRRARSLVGSRAASTIEDQQRAVVRQAVVQARTHLGSRGHDQPQGSGR